MDGGEDVEVDLFGGVVGEGEWEFFLFGVMVFGDCLFVDG